MVALQWKKMCLLKHDDCLALASMFPLVCHPCHCAQPAFVWHVARMLQLDHVPATWTSFGGWSRPFVQRHWRYIWLAVLPGSSVHPCKLFLWGGWGCLISSKVTLFYFYCNLKMCRSVLLTSAFKSCAASSGKRWTLLIGEDKTDSSSKKLKRGVTKRIGSMADMHSFLNTLDCSISLEECLVNLPNRRKTVS